MNPEQLFIKKQCIKKFISGIKELNSASFRTIPCDTETKVQEERMLKRRKMEPIDDCIFHFTKLATFKDHILKEDSLRLSPSSRMSDPIEKNWYFSGLKEIENLNMAMANNIKIACFCKPFHEIESNKIPAYALARMWDQYGDHFNGVCIGFDRVKLENLLNTQFPEHNRVDEIKYTMNLDPEFEFGHSKSKFDQKVHEILNTSTRKIDSSLFLKLYKETDLYGLLFHKSLDYRDENELRLSVYSNQNGYSYIHKIKSAIKLIIIGPNVSITTASQFILDLPVTIYRLVFKSPYSIMGSSICTSFSQSFCKLEILTNDNIKIWQKLDKRRIELEEEDF